MPFFRGRFFREQQAAAVVSNQAETNTVSGNVARIGEYTRCKDW